MASVTLRYKGEVILELDSLGTGTIRTAGRFCEADIELAYINHCPRADQTTFFQMSDFYALFCPYSVVTLEPEQEQEE